VCTRGPSIDDCPIRWIVAGSSRSVRSRHLAIVSQSRGNSDTETYIYCKI
jgi:hypothetical protein